jgi:predicted RNA binding protein YcfA (HicA-like mRNA interferase family)
MVVKARVSLLRRPSLTGEELLRKLAGPGCVELRRRGSHVRVQCGVWATTVPMHSGERLGKGLPRAIERDPEPCLGQGWLQR